MSIGIKEKSKTKIVLFSYTRMFAFGTGIVLAASVTASILNHWHPLSQIAIRVFEYLGYVGWCAALGMRGWDIQTWEGETFPERLNNGLAKLFSVVGIFSFVFARELIPSV